MSNKQFFFIIMACLAAIWLCGCSGSTSGDAPAEEPFKLDKPAAPEHTVSDAGVNSDECYASSDTEGVIGMCRIGNTGNTLVVHWEMEDGWLLDGVEIYSGTEPPSAEITYPAEKPEIQVGEPISPVIGGIQTGPAADVTIAAPEDEIACENLIPFVNLPTGELLELPYRNDDIEPTADLKLTFSLEDCGIGTKLYTWFEVTATREGETTTAVLMDHNLNEVLEQYFRPDLQLPEGELPSNSGGGGGLFHEELGVYPSIYVTLTDCPEGLSVVKNKAYPGWCVQFYNRDCDDRLPVKLYSTLDPDLPRHLRSRNWDAINYCINHRFDYQEDAQGLPWVIWFFSDGVQTFKSSEACTALVHDALTKGEGYVPGVGDWVALIVDRPEGNQDHVIVVEVEDITEL